MALFLQSVLASLPYGCAYALVAVGLVLAYRSTKVFNFALGAEAYAAAVIYAELYAHNVNRTLAAAVVVFVIAPVFGALLDFGLFSRVPQGNQTAKLVMSLGLMVILPNIVQLVVGQNEVQTPASPLFRLIGPVFRIDGQPFTGLDLSVIVVTAAILFVLTVFFHTRRFGLPIRAAVESPRLLELSGVDARWVLRGSWMISTMLAAFAGVVLAPFFVDPVVFQTLLVASLAAATLGGLGSMMLAAVGGLTLGLIQGLGESYFPSSSLWYTALLPSVPFLLLLALLVVHPSLRRLEDDTDPMSSVDPPPPTPALAMRPPILDRAVRWTRWPILVVTIAMVVLFVPSVWVSSLTQGASLSIIFLSITLLTGLAGQLSLAQALFAGIGACTAAQLTSHAHFPVLTAALAGALVAALGGVVAALPALRLRGLPVALLTLCLALLGDYLLFPQSWIIGSGNLYLPRPSAIFGISFQSVDSEGFFVLVVIVMVLVAGLVNLMLRGTTGRALAAVHASPVGAASSGVRARRLTILVFMIAAGVAGLGGAFYGMSLGIINATDFNSTYGPTFLIIVLTVGSTTVEGAIVAGLAYTLITYTFTTYLPTNVGGDQLGTASLTVVLLSLGAFAYAKHPEGLFEWWRRRIAVRVFRAVEAHSSRSPSGPAGPASPSDGNVGSPQRGELTALEGPT